LKWAELLPNDEGRELTMSSFSGEFIKRPVVDVNGDLFGHLGDIVIDPRSGEISEILVEVVPEIDVSKLPWPMNDGLCCVPAQEVAKIGSSISLKR
tara:strand:+ start:2532 stop:2819 length:288 start_codon:yes stop_codon:yes gene_type:complete